MRNPFVHGVGGVLSADIAVPDHERELAFYSKILTTGDNPLWHEDLMNNLGTPVIGLGARVPEYDYLPLQWMPHFQVSDVANSVARAIDMGGKELVHSKTEDGHSHWAVLADQVGAAFGVVPVIPDESDKTQQNERCGRISWLSLTVSDVLASRNFYHQVVGWKAKSIEPGDSKRHATIIEMQINDESAAAEIRQFRSEQHSLPSVWLIHLPVDDLVESLRQVSENGGEIVREYAEEKYAFIRDPVGVYLALRLG